MTAKTIIDKALSYLYTYDNGTHEVIFNDRYYGEHVAGDSYPWCAAFVWCIFNECGASDLFYDGKKTAYYEILDTIKNELDVSEQDLKEYGLDFTLEELL